MLVSATVSSRSPVKPSSFRRVMGNLTSLEFPADRYEDMHDMSTVYLMHFVETYERE